MARGRKQKPYQPSWGGDHITGLYKCPDGRWRITIAGKDIKFTEPDERRAIQRFRAWQEKNQPAPAIDVVSTGPPSEKSAELVVVVDGKEVPADLAQYAGEGMTLFLFAADPTDKASIRSGFRLPESVLFGWLREALIARPEWLAQKTGIPELAGLRHMPLPRPSLRMAEIIAVFKRQSPAGDKYKKRAIDSLTRLAKHAKAKTLDDLTTEKLLAWRQTIEPQYQFGTKKGIYGQVKTVIGFGLKVGLDPEQIRPALDRCKVLWPNGKENPPDPQPISRDDFHRLLAVADGNWRGWLLCGLNFCMHLGEVANLKWSQIDLTKGTYVAIRDKTERKRIPRAAVLWPETVDLLKTLPQKSEYVFVSARGTRFHRNSLNNMFKKLRTLSGVSESVNFEHVRDGAFTAACHNTTDERISKVLAGHACGMSDAYVRRNAEFTRPACDAVYRAYGPF